MNYLKYDNNDIILYDKIQTLRFKKQYIFIEIVVNSTEEAKNYFLLLKDNLENTMEVFIHDKKYINFTLVNCYFDNNLIILEGRNSNE